MNSQNHRKQVLLFLLAVLLPSLVLTVFTWRMISQEKELTDKRLADERRLAVGEFEQLLLSRLEKIKLQVTSMLAGGHISATGSNYRNSEVVLIGRIESDRLLLPWEADQSSGESTLLPGNNAFAQAINQAEYQEFANGDLSQAAVLYRQCTEMTRNPIQKAYAYLSLARTLMKLDRMAEAVKQYRDILTLPSSITDEYGVPFSFYASRSLVEKGTAHSDVLELIQAELERNAWISPAAFYLLRDLVNTIADNALEEHVRSNAILFRQDILEQIKMLELVLSLQRGFQGLGLTSQRDNHVEETEPEWVAYGKNPWLLNLAQAKDGSRVLLIVVEAQAVLTSFHSEGAFSDGIPGKIRLTAGQTAKSFALGPSFRDLQVEFIGESQIPASGWIERRSFYLLTLFLVLGVTSFGAYLLWRDVRREVQTAEMRSQFVSSVSHELKTPLTAIRMFAETLSLGRTRSSESQKEYLGTIVNESERLTRLLNNVLDFSKIETGRMSYQIKTTPLSEVVHAAARTIRYPLSQQGFILNLEIDEGTPAVKADRDALEQAVLNLLSNAMKYSGDSRDIALRLGAKDGHAVIQVTDNGFGIDSQEQENIFEKFYRVRSPENDRITGSGLGLSLVDHVVKAHGGHVTVESTPGKGSTFSIHLPLENNT